MATIKNSRDVLPELFSIEGNGIYIETEKAPIYVLFYPTEKEAVSVATVQYDEPWWVLRLEAPGGSVVEAYLSPEQANALRAQLGEA